MDNAPTPQVKSSSDLTSVEWLNGRPFPHADRPSPIWLTVVIGLGIAALIFMFWSKLLGGIVFAISLAVISIRITLPAVGRSIESVLAHFGRIVGQTLGIVILTPVFLIGFTAARVWCRLTRQDPLQLRPADCSTYWIPADSDRRKTRYIRKMFATENLRSTRSTTLLRWVPLLVTTLLIAELLLRAYGLGRPLLYVNDPVVGYLPVPGQSLVRLGNRIFTNDYGMRAPNYPPHKPPQTLRILMLGDSTLYGGSYVDQDALYARLLEQHLRSDVKPVKVEVLNMGVNGWGPFHKLGFVEKFGTLEADIAIICLPIGDIYRPKYRLRKGGPLHLAGSSPSCALTELYLYLKNRVRRLQRTLQRRTGPTFETRTGQQGEAGSEAYGQLVEKLQASGCEVFVEVLPSPAAGLTDTAPPAELADVKRLHDRLESVGVQANFPVGLFRDAVADSQESMYWDHVHLDVAGHAKYADYLLNHLRTTSHALAPLLTKQVEPSP